MSGAPNRRHVRCSDATVDNTAAPSNLPIPLGNVLLSVDPVAERVTVSNIGSADLDLSEWLLVSVRGDQRFTFQSGTTIAPGEQVVMISGPSASTTPPTGEVFWTRLSIWSNSEDDPARLFDRDGRLVGSTDR